jgi:hypothetical protein
VDLPDDEREALESMIGYGMTEVGGSFKESDAIVRACRRLGLVPKGWRDQPMLPRLDDPQAD